MTPKKDREKKQIRPPPLLLVTYIHIYFLVYYSTFHAPLMQAPQPQWTLELLCCSMPYKQQIYIHIVCVYKLFLFNCCYCSMVKTKKMTRKKNRDTSQPPRKKSKRDKITKRENKLKEKTPSFFCSCFIIIFFKNLLL
jgi:hypothetical protein